MDRKKIKTVNKLLISSLESIIFLLLLSCSTVSNMFSSSSSNTNNISTKGTKDKTSSFSTSPSTSLKSNNETNYQVPSAIHVIDSNTFRVEISYPTVWDALLSILIRNYNILLADSTSGIITTNWDSFYLKENTLRNQISVKVKKLSYNNTELIFHNSVETLKTTTSYIWLPEPDKYNEIERIMNNLAILLNQPPVKISHQNIGTAKRVIQK